MGRASDDELELARRCAEGDEDAWQRFVLQYRPVLYRAADALDGTGNARDIADSLFGELYGLATGGGQRRSLLEYFHGKSSLATWLRTVLAQRYVDRLRLRKRHVSLSNGDSPSMPIEGMGSIDGGPPVHLDRARHLVILRRAMARAVAQLANCDRLRLCCYYLHGMTLEQIGRTLGEHEATTSRRLARTRRAIRQDVERQLRSDAGLSKEQIGECFQSVSEDAGPLDLAELLGAPANVDEHASGRSGRTGQ